MIQARLQINGEIRGRETISGNINGSIKKIYPELENIEINPSKEKQKLKSEKYGYNEITVNEVTSNIDENIKPEYIKEGVSILGVEGGYKGIETSDADATANDIRYNKTAYINGEKVVGTLDEIAQMSLRADKVEYLVGGHYEPTGIVERKDDNDGIVQKGTKIAMTIPPTLLANAINVRSDNLLFGNEVLGIEGEATGDATATSDMIIEGEVAYSRGERITGNIKDNGALNFIPSDIAQEIPKGYTSGGHIEPVDITVLQDYQICERLADTILTGEGV